MGHFSRKRWNDCIFLEWRFFVFPRFFNPWNQLVCLLWCSHVENRPLLVGMVLPCAPFQATNQTWHRSELWRRMKVRPKRSAQTVCLLRPVPRQAPEYKTFLQRCVIWLFPNEWEGENVAFFSVFGKRFQRCKLLCSQNRVPNFIFGLFQSMHDTFLFMLLKSLVKETYI